MKVNCQHGFFIFEEEDPGEVSMFMETFKDIELVSYGRYFTFDDLGNAPDYSIIGKPLIDIPAIKTFEGEPWEVFEANGFVYDFSTGLVRPINSVTQLTSITQAGNILLSPGNGLILPGSITKSGARIKSYSGYWSQTFLSCNYTEVDYV